MSTITVNHKKVPCSTVRRMSSFHSHNVAYELFHVVKGNSVAQIEGDVYSIKDREFLFIPPGKLHKMRHIFIETISITFTPENLSAALKEIVEKKFYGVVLYRINEKDYDEIYNLISKIVSEYNSGKPYSEIACESICSELIIKILRSDPKPLLSKAELINETIRKTADYINENYMKKINVDDLVKSSYMGRTVFYKKFRKIVGYTPNEYITHVRIEAAKKLLPKTSIPIYSIADKTGFSSNAYFSKMFKKFTDETAEQYRRRIQTVVRHKK